MENGVLKLVSYGAFEDETVDDSDQAIDSFIEAYFEAYFDSAGVQREQENGSGQLEDETIWRLYTFGLQGVRVSFLIIANQNDDGAFVVTSLTANTSVFADTITEAQNDFVLNETTRMFEGLNPSEVTQGLPT